MSGEATAHAPLDGVAGTAPGVAAPRTAQRFALVDVLRGVTAVWIMVFHALAAKHLEHLEPSLPWWTLRAIREAPLGVAVFFALSGYVIAHVIGSARVDARYAARFVARRRLRLDPPYFAAIVLVLAVGQWIGLPPESMHHPTVGTVLAHALYLQDLLGIEPFSPVFWTLCLEVQFYVVFCALLVIADRGHSDAERWRARRRVFAVAAVASIAILVPPGKRLAWAPLFPALWYTYLAGTFTAWAVANRIRPVWLGAYLATLTLVSLVTGSHFVLGATATSALLFLAARRPWIDDLVRRPWLVSLGTISYSLYLVHSPVTAVVSRYTLYWLTPRTAAWEAWWLLVFVATSCGAALVFQRLIEQPAIRWSHRLVPSARRRRASAAPSGALTAADDRV